MSRRVSSKTLQQEKVWLNPFDINKDQILEKVYITHFHDVETYDVESLYRVASNIINQSIEISESGLQIDQPREDAGPLASFPRFRALKRIACQMICTPRGEQHAHHTTILILEQLKNYSWDAKAVIALAAFALEYGQFWHIAATPRNPLGKSLAELNGLQSIQENMQHLDTLNSLVRKVMHVIECITEWKKITNATAEYNIKDELAMSDTVQEFPATVYWAIITFVACASDIDFMGDKDYKYELSKFDFKLDLILKEFTNRLEKCNNAIEEIRDYSGRKDIILNDETQTAKDIILVLKALFIPCSDLPDPKLIVSNGLTGEKVGIEVFKKKYVLLFISGLHHIEDDIQLLKSIYEKLKEEPMEVQGYKKEDFNILWVPIVDGWNDKSRKTLETTLESNKIGWYVVKDFNFPLGIKLIREVLNYKDNPIIPLISPEGKIINPDARQILYVWGIEGFPFRSSDHIQLTQQWNWFWTEMINLSPRIKELIDEDNYIFIYGGTDSKWFKDFTEAVDKLKSATTLEDTVIKSYPFGKDDHKIVPRFWIGIDSLFASKQQKKGGAEVLDTATAHIKKLIGLKQDPQGWVILSKGSNVKLMGQGEAMLRTVSEFGNWKDKLNQKVRFDVAFKEYYESKVKEVPPKCAYNEYHHYPTDILAKLPCPIKCGRDMEVDSVNYQCCHGLETTGYGRVAKP